MMLLRTIPKTGSGYSRSPPKEEVFIRLTNSTNNEDTIQPPITCFNMFKGFMFKLLTKLFTESLEVLPMRKLLLM